MSQICHFLVKTLEVQEGNARGAEILLEDASESKPKPKQAAMTKTHSKSRKYWKIEEKGEV